MSWARFFRRRFWHDERAREIEAYLAIEADEQMARGLAPDAARAAARRKLGNRTLILEEIHAMNTVGVVDALWQDLRYACRLLRTNRGFAIVAILSLALGIGANTAIFQLLDAVRMRTLPVERPHELADVKFESGRGRSGSFTSRFSNLTYPQWEEIRRSQQAFSHLFAWSSQGFGLAEGGEARDAQALLVSGDAFTTLGLKTILGRPLGPADDTRGCDAPNVVISHAFWQREFGGAPNVVGRPLRLEGRPLTIVGITDPRFFGLEVGRSFDVALPICAAGTLRDTPDIFEDRRQWWLAVTGRLKPGWTLAQATAHVQALSPALVHATLPREYQPEEAKNYLALRLAAEPGGAGASRLRQQFTGPLTLLLAITGLVLLIACANLANLLLARASAREREMAVRLAIGASRGRLVRQLLVESLVLACLGAAAGIVLARWLSAGLLAALDSGPVLFVQLTTDWRVLGFTALLALTTSLLFGLLPAWRATRTSPGVAIAAEGRGMTANRERFGLRRTLVVLQVACSLVLLVGALLFVRSMQNLLTVDTGFESDNVLVASLNLRRAQMAGDRLLQLRRDLLARVRALPGVSSASDSFIVPIGGSLWNQNLVIDGATSDARGTFLANFNRIGAGYFRTMRTPIVAGRDFDERDTTQVGRVAIVTESFVSRFLNGRPAIGARFGAVPNAGDPTPSYEIVGVVKDSKYGSLRETFAPIVYVPTEQDPEPGQGLNLVIRGSSTLDGLAPAITRRVAEVNPSIVLEFSVLRTEIGRSLRLERLMAVLSSGFGVLAGLLATIGLYGVLSYMVARRRREIGIRMALGAQQRDVLRMILREAAVLVGIGLVIGAAAALLAAPVVRSLMFGLTPRDPMTLALSMALLAGIALIAGYVPAARAARVDPASTLRAD